MRGLETDGKAIRELRRQRGTTQEQLAALANIDVKTLRKAEGGGRLDLPIVGRIAEALQVNLSQIAASAGGKDVQDQNMQTVRSWNDAFFARDLELAMSFHHPEVELIIPNSEGLPGGGNFRGIEEMRRHLTEVFAALDEYQLFGMQIHAVEDFVFLRSEASARIIANGKRFGSYYSNEFRLVEGLIVHRTVITDFASMRDGFADA